ncbi:unnamed protein product [Ostreobium quekettii]|uniref:RZ-type domain-containing protein n=1 Tax=Ostreobium quekettii TaxID=121088 RepID=A0A8S1IPR4_9CHLO|nr:unnamed protein product [Ostreobium quekettii]
MQLALQKVHHIGATSQLRIVGDALPFNNYPREARGKQLLLVDRATRMSKEALSDLKSREGPKIPDFDKRVGEVQQHMEALQTVRNEVEKAGRPSAEQAACIWAVISADSRVSNATYGSGHVYRCPNGHVYIIGECGRAWEEARCAECGATIGGRNHKLASGNAAADDMFEEVRDLAMGRTKASDAPGDISTDVSAVE